MAGIGNLLKKTFSGMKGELYSVADALSRRRDEAQYRDISVKDPEYKIFQAVAYGTKGIKDHIDQVDFSARVRLGDVPEHHFCGGKKLVKGMTPAMVAAREGGEAIRAFYDLGGAFDLARDSLNRDAGWFAAKKGLDAMKAFVECGGNFTNAQEVKQSMFFDSTAGSVTTTYGDTTLMLALRQGAEGGRLALENGATMDMGQTSHRHNALIAPGVNKSDDFIGDAGTVALRQGLETAEFYLKNGGVFLERHARAAILGGPDIMRFFSSHGGKYPGDGSLSPMAVRGGVETVWAYQEGDGMFNGEAENVAKKTGGEIWENFQEASEHPSVVRHFGNLEL